MLKLVLLLCITFFGISSCVTDTNMRQSSPNLPSFNEFRTNGKNLHPATIRLADANDYFHCTGFVIDGTYAMTAAHCVTGTLGIMSKDIIKIYDAYGNYSGNAVAVAVDRFQDVAFIKGDFTNFEFKQVDFTGKNAKLGMHVMACGFPAGQYEIYCAELIHIGNNYFRYAMTGGPIFKGQSGGPVTELTSGNVIGVNSAVDVDTVVIGPVIGTLESAGIR